MTIRLNGSTSGYVELDAPAVAGTSSFTLPTGTGSLLAAEGGKVLQVVTGTTSTSVTTTSTSYVTTGLSASITPTKTTSKVLVLTSISMEKVSANDFSGTFTALFRGTVSGTNIQESAIYVTANANLISQVSLSVLDSPNTTSAQTYTVGYKTGSSSTTVAAVRGYLATMILMEISA